MSYKSVWPNNARLALSLVINVEEGAEMSVANGDTRAEPGHPLNVEKIILSLCFNWPVKPMLFYSNSVIWGCPIP